MYMLSERHARVFPLYILLPNAETHLSNISPVFRVASRFEMKLVVARCEQFLARTGKEVLVEAIDGAKYSGIFCACFPEFDIGLRHTYKITTGNSENLLPKWNMTAKMLFKFSDIVAMSALMNEEVVRGCRLEIST
ncbi:unnamed protein product [Cylicocyclus nassatus]|uniref:Ataxin 2 SM domain-containing protein n=1 Tax=Cylicocyclus nassatus TaxID=53992 RepID=A0AA36HBB3_CYLNA|nr:unnamed protein product [Cylicocyclus nassatus]